MPIIEKRGAYWYQKINGRYTRVATPHNAPFVKPKLTSKTGGSSKKKSKKKYTGVPTVGQTVKINIKPYTGTVVTGVVKRVLTRKSTHTRGHKVMLVDGTVGRVTSY